MLMMRMILLVSGNKKALYLRSPKSTRITCYAGLEGEGIPTVVNSDQKIKFSLSTSPWIACSYQLSSSNLSAVIGTLKPRHGSLLPVAFELTNPW
jgi:hypothetical protein